MPAMQAGNALCYTIIFPNQFKNNSSRFLVWKGRITNFPEKNELLPIFSSVKLGYKKTGNTETEKFQNLYYEQNIYFKQKPKDF